MQPPKEYFLKFKTSSNIDSWKHLVFQGKILCFQNSKSVDKLVSFTQKYLKKKFNLENVKDFEHNISSKEFFSIILRIKYELANSNYIKTLIKNILTEFQVPTERTFFDKLRIRCVTSYAHTLEEAKPAFAIHRDTWYANPETQINWWIPIFDVSKLDTFAFFPKYFSKPVQNNSNEFDFEIWKDSGGFGSDSPNQNRIFPELKENIDWSQELKIPMQSGELLVFSASQLHGTRPNLTNQTRFSLDFRTIDSKEILSAPNVDNKSKGSILKDMIQFI